MDVMHFLKQIYHAPANLMNAATKTTVGNTNYSTPLLGSPATLLHHAANSFNNDVLQAPGHALEKIAIATSGAHPLGMGQTVNSATDPYYYHMVQPILQKPQLYDPKAPLQQSTHPLLQLISAAYGGLQPFEAPQPEDSYTATQALQPLSYDNGQNTLYGGFQQGSQNPGQPNYMNQRLQVMNNVYKGLR